MCVGAMCADADLHYCGIANHGQPTGVYDSGISSCRGVGIRCARRNRIRIRVLATD